MTIDYVPVPMIGTLNIVKKNVQWNNYSPDWWEQNSFFRYPKMLVSAFFGRDFLNMRESLRIPKDMWILGDSGGFQNITRDTNLTPEEVLKWAQENVQATLTLDYPLVTKISGLNMKFILANQREIEKRLEKTANDARIMHDKRTTNLELIFVTHGNTWDDFDLALKKLKDQGLTLDDFEGESKALKGDNPLIVSMKILHSLKNVPKGKRFHFLGLSGIHTTLALYYASSYRPDLKITFDSTSFCQCGETRREYWIIDRRYNVSFATTNRETRSITGLPCDCPVCKIVKDSSFFMEDGTIPGSMISLHNLWLWLRYTDVLRSLSSDRDALREFAIKFVGDKSIIGVFDFIDHVWRTDDVQGGLRKYRNLVNWNEQESMKSKSSLDAIFSGDDKK